MKHLITLVSGLLTGAALFALALIYNPLFPDGGLSPLAVTKAQVLSLNFSPVPSESIVYTNDGDSLHQPDPGKVQRLWEAPIQSTSAQVLLMRGARNQPVGIGIKISSDSEATQFLKGKALADSVWYVYLPGQGSLFIQQTENYWSFLQDVGFPAWRSAGNNWRGSWLGDLTAGPGVLGTAQVSGGSGVFAGLDTEAVESLSVRAFSSELGLVSAQGRLIVELRN
jgi:hypothetical protein